MRAHALALIVAACLTSTGGWSQPQAPGSASSSGAADLVPLPGAKVKFAKVRPGTDWAKYHTIELAILRVPAEVRDAAPKGTRPGFGESYVLRDQDVAALQDAYAGAMRDELSKAGFTFVTTPGPDTLIVLAQILKIELTAPIGGHAADIRRPRRNLFQEWRHHGDGPGVRRWRHRPGDRRSGG